ncbi:CBK_G0031700.mRNA.1.CDS.1 [Saccharomyces cerevisiae]|nr:CBK_G0031700.mRNA.1.CDS.1 [Saccharomyces cerevisiae]CAI7378010.1 CBK_G0031700.mRNA.1.CDS.1 [Saccharomyces cerevisiae]
MDDQTKKDGLDIVHVEFSPDTRAPSDSNKVITEIFDATEDAKEADESEKRNATCDSIEYISQGSSLVTIGLYNFNHGRVRHSYSWSFLRLAYFSEKVWLTK